MTSWPVTSPEREVTAELIDTLVQLAGYPHPLFNPTTQQRAQGVTAPLMGQGVLLLAGALAERTGTLEDAVALVGLQDVRFHRMVRAGARIRLVMDLRSTTPTGSGRRRSEYSWTVLDQDDAVVLNATAVLIREASTEEM